MKKIQDLEKKSRKPSSTVETQIAPTPRADKLRKLGIYSEVMWHENFTEDRPGQFDRERQALEWETLEQVFDRWCRGRNLIGFANLILRRVDQIRAIAGKTPSVPGAPENHLAAPSKP